MKIQSITSQNVWWKLADNNVRRPKQSACRSITVQLSCVGASLIRGVIKSDTCFILKFPSHSSMISIKFFANNFISLLGCAKPKDDLRTYFRPLESSLNTTFPGAMGDRLYLGKHQLCALCRLFHFFKTTFKFTREDKYYTYIYNIILYALIGILDK
jgi:hypothetical protein